jgi:hypothetical protein
MLPFTMVAMKPRLVVLLLCASLLPAVQAFAKTILPDSCGDASIKFDVSTKKNQPPPAPPEAGKAQIVFIESGRGLVARYGVDGAWAGANEGDSYFAVAVAPGEHHLCMSFQLSALYGKMKEESVRMLTFSAEAGKVYYFEASVGAVGGSMGSTTYVQNTGGAPGGQFVHSGGSPGMPVFGFAQLDEDTGKFRIKAWKLATWKTK